MMGEPASLLAAGTAATAVVLSCALFVVKVIRWRAARKRSLRRALYIGAVGEMIARGVQTDDVRRWAHDPTFVDVVVEYLLVVAGINVARYPYILLTDADVVFDGECLVRAMRHVVENRERVVAVGGNIRPINGSVVNRGRVVETHMPKRSLERAQLLEYVRSFIGARPGWSRINGLVLISGAFGIYDRRSWPRSVGSDPGI